MSSKFNIGSVIYDATTGTEQGKILHDGNYTATTTPTDDDTILIKQSGVTKQITHKNLVWFQTLDLLGNTTTTGTIDISARRSVSSVIVITVTDGTSERATLTTRASALTTSSFGPATIYVDNIAAAEFYRNTSSTTITVDSLASGFRVEVYELKVKL
jgi:hypothetical protein